MCRLARCVLVVEYLLQSQYIERNIDTLTSVSRFIIHIGGGFICCMVIVKDG